MGNIPAFPRPDSLAARVRLGLSADAAIIFPNPSVGLKATAPDVAARLRELCPDGINIFFDNVGGEILDAVLVQLALNARIVLCGAISRYNDEELQPGPKNYFNLIIQRARMEGFLLSDYFPRVGEAVAELLGWLAEGKIVHQEDIQEGFENAPQTFFRLFEGKNLGKQLLKIADLPLERN